MACKGCKRVAIRIEPLRTDMDEATQRQILQRNIELLSLAINDIAHCQDIGCRELQNLSSQVTVTTDDDELVKVTSNDTTEDVLRNKLTAGFNVTLTTLNPGADEDLEIKGSKSAKIEMFSYEGDVENINTTDGSDVFPNNWECFRNTMLNTGSILNGGFELPSDWDGGDIKIRLITYLFTSPGGTANRTFEIGAYAISGGDSLDVTITESDTITISMGTQYQMEYGEATVTIANTPAAGDTVLFKVRRSDAEAVDPQIHQIIIEVGRT